VSETAASTGAAARAGGAATATATANADDSLTVHGLTSDQVGDLAFEHGVRLHELTVVRASLEEAFMELTADSVEYRAGHGPGTEPGPDDKPVADGTASGQPAVEDSYRVEGRI